MLVNRGSCQPQASHGSVLGQARPRVESDLANEPSVWRNVGLGSTSSISPDTTRSFFRSFSDAYDCLPGLGVTVAAWHVYQDYGLVPLESILEEVDASYSWPSLIWFTSCNGPWHAHKPFRTWMELTEKSYGT